MKPPAPEEVTAYAKSIDFELDGEEFCDHYEISGWVYGKNRTPIKSWQACVRTWKRTRTKWRKENDAKHNRIPNR